MFQNFCLKALGQILDFVLGQVAIELTNCNVLYESVDL